MINGRTAKTTRNEQKILLAYDHRKVTMTVLAKDSRCSRNASTEKFVNVESVHDAGKVVARFGYGSLSNDLANEDSITAPVLLLDGRNWSWFQALYPPGPELFRRPDSRVAENRPLVGFEYRTNKAGECLASCNFVWSPDVDERVSIRDQPMHRAGRKP